MFVPDRVGDAQVCTANAGGTAGSWNKKAFQTSRPDWGEGFFICGAFCKFQKFRRNF
jgi:hypothetical protein